MADENKPVTPPGPINPIPEDYVTALQALNVPVPHTPHDPVDWYSIRLAVLNYPGWLPTTGYVEPPA